MDRRAWLGVGAALIVLGLAGCEAESLRLAPVRGKVSHKGVPLRGGIIVFTPDAVRSNGGPMSHAEIQTDGSYVLRGDDGPGALPGWHRVTITAFGDVDARGALPARYGDPEQSGLRFEVKPGQENNIDIELE
jgi:hypothetical protein